MTSTLSGSRSGHRDPAAAGAPPRRRPLTERVLGKHPLGWLFGAPYLIFVLVIFAYPLIFAGYMSFHDYFFAAPGARVNRPFVGLENYTDALHRPGGPAVVRQRRRLLDHQRAADRGARAGAGHPAQPGRPACGRSCGSASTCRT